MFEEEEDGTIIMSQKSILECCRKHNLYQVPDLNDSLHLESVGFTKIRGLDNFFNLQVLWLNNNQLTSICGLSNLTKLKSLYLHENFIETISGLENLVNLEVLIMSRNMISKIEGLENLQSLTTLDLDNNRIKDTKCIDGIACCKKIQILHLAQNGMEGGDPIEILQQLPDLRVLNLEGNPICRSISNYRRVMISKLRTIRYLDDEPVDEETRRLNDAWIKGGKAEEMNERHKIRAEKEKRHKDDMREFRRMQRDALIKSGGSIESYPELLSSDDESAQEKMKHKFALMVENKDGTIVVQDKDLDTLD